jgi:uncharacterized protein YciI
MNKTHSKKPPHVAFLQKYYAAGNFLVSGRQIPRVAEFLCEERALRLIQS